jgi:hypothetical protein
MRATQGFNEKIMPFFSVLAAYSTHLNIWKSGPNQNYNFCIYNFNLQAPKWVSLIENITPIVFSRSNFNSLSEEDYF